MEKTRDAVAYNVITIVSCDDMCVYSYIGCA